MGSRWAMEIDIFSLYHEEEGSYTMLVIKYQYYSLGAKLLPTICLMAKQFLNCSHPLPQTEYISVLEKEN